MPLFKTTFFSMQVLGNVKMNIYIPDANAFDYQDLDVVLLCHGMGGDADDWIKTGNIIRTADECHAVVVMPKLDNSFGVDMVNGYNAEKYIIEEVYELSHRWLNLNRQKEKNIIAGLSMGGYIALNLGIKYQNLFSHIISLSAPTNLEDMVNIFPQDQLTTRIIKNAFGSGDFTNSEKCITNQAKTKEINVKIDLYCGSNDHFYPFVKNVYQILKERKINVTFLEDDGNHSWYYWEKYLREFLLRR